MPRHLKGARYLRPDSRVTDLPKAITDLLPTLDMAETLKFYDAFLSLDPTPSDHALLALNDLFYLLTGLCGRRDMLHPWLFDRAREVEAAPDGFLDLWARGHYKSTIVTFGKPALSCCTSSSGVPSKMRTALVEPTGAAVSCTLMLKITVLGGSVRAAPLVIQVTPEALLVKVPPLMVVVVLLA